MEAFFIAVYKVRGANTLAESTEGMQLFSGENPRLTAIVTAYPEAHFTHIDRAAALGNQLLKGIFAPDEAGSWQQRLTIEIDARKIRRQKQTETGVFVIFNGQVDVPAPKLTACVDLDEFCLAFRASNNAPVREIFWPSLHATLTSLNLYLNEKGDRSFEKIGDVTYFFDSATQKPIYAYRLEGSAVGLYMSGPLTRETVSAANAAVPRLLSQSPLTRPTSLLFASLDRATDKLQAFIAAWSGLEIFINATFKSDYEARWLTIMKDGAPFAANLVFERFREVMKDKYRLVDKFLIIASVLDPDLASDDEKEFRRLKKVRDELFHAVAMPPYLPTEPVQKLLMKYLHLHLLA